MACETEMNLGCGGTLKVAYFQDNRLGNVNHAAVAEAVATLPPAFAKGAGGKQIWLWLALPLMIAGFVTTVIVVGAMQASLATMGSATDAIASSAAQADCGKMGDPGWFECRKSNMDAESEHDSNVRDTKHKQAANGMIIRFAISGLLMIAWFASSALLMCLRASAANDGFEGLRRKLGELNQKMSPLNFSMRTDVVQSYGYSGINDDNHSRRTRIMYRYFLVIMNSTGGGGASQDYPRTRGLQDEEAGEEKTDEEEEEEVEEEDDDESNSRRCIIS